MDSVAQAQVQVVEVEVQVAAAEEGADHLPLRPRHRFGVVVSMPVVVDLTCLVWGTNSMDAFSCPNDRCRPPSSNLWSYGYVEVAQQLERRSQSSSF